MTSWGKEDRKVQRMMLGLRCPHFFEEVFSIFIVSGQLMLYGVCKQPHSYSSSGTVLTSVSTRKKSDTWESLAGRSEDSFEVPHKSRIEGSYRNFPWFPRTEMWQGSQMCLRTRGRRCARARSGEKLKQADERHGPDGGGTFQCRQLGERATQRSSQVWPGSQGNSCLSPAKQSILGKGMICKRAPISQGRY